MSALIAFHADIPRLERTILYTACRDLNWGHMSPGMGVVKLETTE
jgi:hypothetical protein